MFRPILAGLAALALLIGAAPKAAQANDDVIYGILIGAAAGGLIAVIADNDRDDRRYDRRTERVRDYDRGRRHDVYRSDRRYERYDRRVQRDRYRRDDYWRDDRRDDWRADRRGYERPYFRGRGDDRGRRVVVIEKRRPHDRSPRQRWER